MAQMVENPPAMRETLLQFLGWEDPWTREALPTPVCWPGEFHGQRSLGAYSPWGPKELDPTEWLSLSPVNIDSEEKFHRFQTTYLLTTDVCSLCCSQWAVHVPIWNQSWWFFTFYLIKHIPLVILSFFLTSLPDYSLQCVNNDAISAVLNEDLLLTSFLSSLTLYSYTTKLFKSTFYLNSSPSNLP